MRRGYGVERQKERINRTNGLGQRVRRVGERWANEKKEGNNMHTVQVGQYGEGFANGVAHWGYSTSSANKAKLCQEL